MRANAVTKRSSRLVQGSRDNDMTKGLFMRSSVALKYQEFSKNHFCTCLRCLAFNS
ncbi:hypothetical protein BMIN_1204 [Bifidobacterium minimum]|uniref:Uncharacterized protein n=1 Tax=Bifidobacterium minimum TaxID=1693 RepID=A0A087BT15_9BIFI|nr:hypothetical protein BMIN_1204 [Bifidobacterium minimum]PKA94274.1 hypothetical protein A9A89_0468 [Bifidobacterium psychraerophilum DSM 22366]